MHPGSSILSLAFWIASGALVGGVVASIVGADKPARSGRRILAGMGIGAGCALVLLVALNNWWIALIGLLLLVLGGVGGLVLASLVPVSGRFSERLPAVLRRWIGDWQEERSEAEETTLSGWPEGLPRGVYWVRPGRLMAGPYPYAILDRVLAAGVTHFVNLTQPRELMPYDGVLPPSVSHERHSIPDLETPSRVQMRATLDAIDDALDEGKTVYVHCWGGIGRTGTVIGCWLVRHGMSGQAALDELVQLRGGYSNSPETDEQHAFVRHWREA